MCGILLVKSTHSYEQHLRAFDKLSRRGPDLSVHQYRNNIFIGQTVLHITGSDEYYKSADKRKHFLAYNGEIYNYRRLGYYSNDVELIDHLVPDHFNQFKQLEGMWAWAWTDFDQIWYASDPQGEKCLYRYQTNDTLIVCSEIAPILEYQQLNINISNYTTKHWPIVQQTPWQGIERVPAGQAFNLSQQSVLLDSLFDWRADVKYSSIDQAEEEFTHLFARIIADITPDEPYAIGYSGGVDTSCILSALPHADHLYSINTLGKDTISNRSAEFLNDQQQNRLTLINVDQESWAEFFKQVVDYTCLPALSWSFVGQWIVASQCQERVIFSGVGADELFGGYSVYNTLEYTAEHSTSPYSYFVDNQDLQTIWDQCMDFYQDPQQATLLMDYLIQCAAVDLRGVDSCTQAFGIEPRSPFTHPAMIKFALNLPWEYKQGKPLLKRMFLKHWPEHLLLPKQGFAGHCNDSYDYLGIDIVRQADRQDDWRNILRASFISVCSPIN